MKDIVVTKIWCSLKIPVIEQKTELEVEILEAEILPEDMRKPSEKYRQHEQMEMCVRVTDHLRDEVIEHDIFVASKNERFQEIMERGLYNALRMCSDSRYHIYPSSCGFYYWHTFRKLRPWIRENGFFSAYIEANTEDGTAMQIECRRDGAFDLSAEGEYLGRLEVKTDRRDTWWERSDRMEEDLIGGAADFRQELALFEDIYLSKRLMTKAMEQALSNHQHKEGRARADEKVIAMYYCDPLVYTPSDPAAFHPAHGEYRYQKRPFQYYIIRGEKCREDYWCLYGLIHMFGWEWGEILLGVCEEEIPALPLPPGTLRKTDVFGQRLEDVLKQYGQPGWEKCI